MKNILITGIVAFVAGFLLDMLFIQLGIVGYLREGARLTTLIGLALIIIGLFKKILVWRRNKNTQTKVKN